MGMVYDLLAKSAITEFIDAEAEAIDHNFGKAGIDQWVLDITRKKKERNNYKSSETKPSYEMLYIEK